VPIEAPSDESAFREMPHHERRSLWPSAVSARAAFLRERSQTTQRFYLEAFAPVLFGGKSSSRSQVFYPPKLLILFLDSASQRLENHANRRIETP